MINNKEDNAQDAVENETESAVEVKKKSRLTRRKRKSAKDEIAELKQENGELKDKYLRLFAEFDNYKKRTVREKLDLMRNAAQDTLSALLPVLDDFDRAKLNAEDTNSDESLSDGVLLVYNKLYSTLNAFGLKAMESTNEVFDPELHMAITEIPAPSKDMKGKVVDTIDKGYFLNDKIIRHAKVVVGR
jgi:molecular chaperone GrpE